MALGRGIGALAVGVAVALAGGLLAIGLAEANPSPASVLSSTRRFVDAATAVSYSARVTITGPAASDGSEVVRHLAIAGRVTFPHAFDCEVTEGARVSEYLFAPGSSGVLLRSDVGWTHTVGLPPLVDASLVRSILDQATSARRHGDAAWSVDVSVRDQNAEVDATRRGRPTRVVVTQRASGSTVTAIYAFSGWNAGVSVVAPEPSEVSPS